MTIYKKRRIEGYESYNRSGFYICGNDDLLVYFEKP